MSDHGKFELPQSIVDSDVYMMGFMAGRLFEVTLINEEYLDAGGWELVNKDEFIKHLGSLAVAVGLMKEHGTLGRQSKLVSKALFDLVDLYVHGEDGNFHAPANYMTTDQRVMFLRFAHSLGGSDDDD